MAHCLALNPSALMPMQVDKAFPSIAVIALFVKLLLSSFVVKSQPDNESSELLLSYKIEEVDTGITRAAKLLEENPNPTEEEIRFGMAGNLCRCTGYQNIVKSIQAAAAEMNAAKEAAE